MSFRPCCKSKRRININSSVSESTRRSASPVQHRAPGKSQGCSCCSGCRHGQTNNSQQHHNTRQKPTNHKFPKRKNTKSRTEQHKQIKTNYPTVNLQITTLKASSEFMIWFFLESRINLHRFHFHYHYQRKCC